MIDVAVFNYNGASTLPSTLRTLSRSTGIRVGTIFVVDDGSTDDSPRLAREFPNVEVIALPENTGNINFVRNTGLGAGASDRILLTDNDVEFSPECLARLNATIDETGAVAVTPRLLFSDDRTRIYADGTRFHYLCAAAALNRNESAEEAAMVLPPERTFTCGILLLDRATLPDDVRFDESLPFSWGTDGEFYLRLAFMGYRCVHEPRAVAYHHAKARQLEKAEGHISTRWRLLLTYYRWRTLAVLAPALALYELGALAFFVAKRRPGVYFRYMAESFRSLPDTLKARRAIQALRRTTDRSLMCADPIYVAPHLLDRRLLRFGHALLNRVLTGYWKIVRPVVG